MPSTLAPRRRRRRFPERELLERLHKYEDLLRRNNIKFDPLHKEPAEKESPSPYASENEQLESVGAYGLSSSTIIQSERVYEAKYVLSRNLF
jgi:hypothetical protein